MVQYSYDAWGNGEETGLFYTYTTLTNGSPHYGIGINVAGWLGVSAEISTDSSEYILSIGMNITPWFHFGIGIGGNGVSLKFGVDIGDVAHDFEIGIGLGMCVVGVGIALIVVTAGTAIDMVVQWFSSIFSFV